MLATGTRILLPILVFATPLVLWTATPNFFTSPKQLMIILVALSLILLHAVDIVRTKSITFSSSRLRLPLALFALALVANLVFMATGRTEALVERGSLYLSCLLLAYYASMAGTSLKKSLTNALIVSTSLLALHGLLQLTLLHSATWLPTFMQTKGFTPTGSTLTTLTLLIIAAPAALVMAYKRVGSATKGLYAGAGILMIIASVAYLSLMLPGGELTPRLLSFSTSWSIALDSMKNLPSIFLGVGLGDFASHYTSVKPLIINSTELWNILPASLSTEALHLLTTTGVIGLAGFLFLVLYALRVKTSVALIISSLVLLTTPASVPVVLIFLVLLGAAYAAEPKSRALPSPLHASGITALLLLFVAILLYFGGRVTLAELAMGRGTRALAAGDGRTVYEETLRAVQLVPSMQNYRLAYANINLRLASTLSQKSSLSDQERESIAQLVSQAVREARVAASLKPRDATAWAAVGNVYRNLVNVAEGADQFALAAFAQAVTLDPGNPVLRIEYGGLLYQLGVNAKDKTTKDNYLTQARDQFSLATQLKKDYANAFYNLSHTLELLGNIQGATTAMEQVIKYINPESPDFSSAQTELEELRAKLPSTTTPIETDSGLAKASELTEPSPLPSPLPGGPVDLPTQ